MLSTLAPALASIPSPPFKFLSIGPLSFHIYGLCIALGALAGVELARRRWAAGGRDPEQITSVALIAVPSGLIGARIYHVITDFPDLYSDGRWWPNAFFIWQGGLGIPGGVLGGVIGALIAARYKKMPWREMGDAVAPAMPLAQAIGRFGNYFNQELFGGPTKLPWGLQVDMDVRARPIGASPETLFHPTFLYEALWNFGLCAAIVIASGKIRLKPGRWFPVYIAGYGLGRLWVESLRIDAANEILGLRVNTWTSLLAIIGGLGWLFWGGSPIDHSPVGVGNDEAVSTGGGALDADSADADSVEVDSVEAGSDGNSEVVGESGPGVHSPVIEGPISGHDTPESGVGIDPQE